MSQFDFEDKNEFKSREVFGEYKKPGLVNWLQRKGIVKSDKTAQFILIVVIVLCFALAGFVFVYGFGGNSGSEGLSDREIQQLPEEMRRVYSEE